MLANKPLNTEDVPSTVSRNFAGTAKAAAAPPPSTDPMRKSKKLGDLQSSSHSSGRP